MPNFTPLHLTRSHIKKLSQQKFDDDINLEKCLNTKEKELYKDFESIINSTALTASHSHNGNPSAKQLVENGRNEFIQNCFQQVQKDVARLPKTTLELNNETEPKTYAGADFCHENHTPKVQEIEDFFNQIASNFDSEDKKSILINYFKIAFHQAGFLNPLQAHIESAFLTTKKLAKIRTPRKEENTHVQYCLKIKQCDKNSIEITETYPLPAALRDISGRVDPEKPLYKTDNGNPIATFQMTSKISISDDRKIIHEITDFQMIQSEPVAQKLFDASTIERMLVAIMNFCCYVANKINEMFTAEPSPVAEPGSPAAEPPTPPAP